MPRWHEPSWEVPWFLVPNPYLLIPRIEWRQVALTQKATAMKRIVVILSLACSFAACAQSSIPMAPVPQAPSAPAQASPLDQDGQATPITRVDAERMALKNNPRITASHLLALAAGLVTREIRSNELPQINGNVTAVKAEDGGRIGSGELNSSRLYTHAGTGGTFSLLLTDFRHTRNLVAHTRLQG